MSTQPASRVAKAAARYRPGKAPVGAGESYSSDEDVSAEQKEMERREEVRPTEALGRGYAPIKTTSRPNVAKTAEIDINENETDSEEEDDKARAARPVFRQPLPQSAARAPPPPSSSEEDDEESSEESNSSSSSESVAPLPTLKPIFKSKKERSTVAAPSSSAAIAGEVQSNIMEGPQDVHFDDDDEEEEAAKKAKQQRKQQSYALAAERIKQELQEREDRESKPDLDDTDGLDPEAEFQAWRKREEARLQRERDADRIREAERTEKERRRTMSESQRLAEDLAYARKTRDEKRKGEQGFMQKYHHKGSFFQDSDLLKSRDFSAMTENAVDKSTLPKIMQVRDYGKKGRSKWTHLANEDTSRRQ